MLRLIFLVNYNILWVIELLLTSHFRYHMECLIPALGEIPAGNWYCLICQPIVASQVDVASSSQVWSSW